MNISFYDIDRALDDMLADIGANENTRKLARCEKAKVMAARERIERECEKN